MNPPNSSSTAGKGKQSPCAACAHASQQCSAGCLLRPYFPNDAEHMATFQNVLKLFGKQKVLKLLTELQPDQREYAITSITFEANAWEKYPVQGCIHMINTLIDNVRAVEWRIELVRQKLLALDKSRCSSSVAHGPNVQSTSCAAQLTRCAACTYEKQICYLECPFRNYFPTDDEENRAAYIKVQKVFRYANVMNMVMGLRPEERDQAMKSFISEAELCDKNPGRCCLYFVDELRIKILAEWAELHGLEQILAFVRGQTNLKPLDESRSSSRVPDGQSTSCAACAYEKQICKPECPFRHYFPNDDEENRAAYTKVHKVFEYGNILNMVKGFGPEESDQAMKSFIFEADLWDKNPGCGCLPCVQELEQKISAEWKELQGLQEQFSRIMGQTNQEPLGESSMNLDGAV